MYCSHVAALRGLYSPLFGLLPFKLGLLQQFDALLLVRKDMAPVTAAPGKDTTRFKGACQLPQGICHLQIPYIFDFYAE